MATFKPFNYGQAISDGQTIASNALKLREGARDERGMSAVNALNQKGFTGAEKYNMLRKSGFGDVAKTEQAKDLKMETAKTDWLKSQVIPVYDQATYEAMAQKVDGTFNTPGSTFSKFGATYADAKIGLDQFSGRETEKPDDPYGKINPSQYTQESVKIFDKTKNKGDLVSKTKEPLVNFEADKADKAYLEKRFKDQAEMMTNVTKGAEASYNEMRALDRFLASSKDSTEGGAQPIISGVKNFLTSFGAKFKGLKDVAEMEQAIGDIKVNFFKEFDARGLTDKDMEIIHEALPRLATSREARENVVRILKKSHAKKIEGYEQLISEEKRAYPEKSKKIFTPKWYTDYIDYSQEGDLTPEETSELQMRESIGFGKVERTDR